MSAQTGHGGCHWPGVASETQRHLPGYAGEASEAGAILRPTSAKCLDASNTVSNHVLVPKNAPTAPPIVSMGTTGTVAHLLDWELVEADGHWYAWLSWVQQIGSRPVHKVVQVRADSVQPLEDAEAYARVPRRVLAGDGIIRPWSGHPLLDRGQRRPQDPDRSAD
jgi:hypothetical protein